MDIGIDRRGLDNLEWKIKKKEAFDWRTWSAKKNIQSGWWKVSGPFALSVEAGGMDYMLIRMLMAEFGMDQPPAKLPGRYDTQLPVLPVVRQIATDNDLRSSRISPSLD